MPSREELNLRPPFQHGNQAAFDKRVGRGPGAEGVETRVVGAEGDGLFIDPRSEVT